MTATRTMQLALACLIVSSCARGQDAAPAPAPHQIEFGAHRVTVVVPSGWDALDQGRQKHFRKGEFEIVLRDLGPRTFQPGGPSVHVEWGLRTVGHDDNRR